MLLYSITELSVFGAYDRGVPNQERIIIYANETVNLGQYGLMIGMRLADGTAFPLRDTLLWFGDGILNEGDWLLVYTGPGQARATELPNSQGMLYTVHWGRLQTFLNDQNFVPVLFRVDAVCIKPPEAFAALLDGEQSGQSP